VFIRGEICFAQSNHRLWIGGLTCLGYEMSARQGALLGDCAILG